ncbi:type II toxin-antitoxin system Y4mF family antitoxin [Duganella sp. FT92W]|uniref:Type II toxin-antitoxin system Y4mF family antitoxin n=1 Tax=Pseudoduganella rivuli TaxID=2666085 RepID=A0A7X2IMV7_9BURK|nr:helix-turn-helix transcriptional regulator [Pseudoduganella rivuli]MRV72957.1 type II toxin-antitoxin system Y4mF family antitoxin [Pseudoduganella rivuli]
MPAPTPPSTLETTSQLGELVRAIRKEQGLTQLDVAGLAGMSNRFVIDLERGKETLQMQKVLDVLALLGLEVVIRKKA